jgi:translocator assembly and maintenance protein 41
MERQAAIRDLTRWEFLYLAGRMHKPVLTLQSCSEVVAAQRQNVRAAIATALLLCSHSFTKMQFLHTLCAISYYGA